MFYPDLQQTFAPLKRGGEGSSSYGLGAKGKTVITLRSINRWHGAKTPGTGQQGQDTIL